MLAESQATPVFALTPDDELETRVRWLQQRAEAQLRYALGADNVYDKNERISIAMILCEHAAEAVHRSSRARLSS